MRFLVLLFALLIACSPVDNVPVPPSTFVAGTFNY